MQSSVKVNCGKPVLKLKYRTLRAIAILVTCLCVIIILYCINLLILAVQTRYTLGVYIDYVSGNGKALPIYLALTATVTIFMDAFTIYYINAAFSKTKNSHISTMLFTLVVMIFLVILLIFINSALIINHAYSAHVEMHDGIIDAMRNYSRDSLTKEVVDTMQVEYECCGSKNYTDWYAIKWYDANLVNTDTFPGLKGETPFSCCAIQSVYPCIHHGVEVTAPAYIYSKDANMSISTQGCHRMVLLKKQAIGWSLVWRLLILALLQLCVLIGLRLIQTGHLERKAFDREERMYTCWLIGCYAGKTKTVIPPPVPPLPPELCCE